MSLKQYLSDKIGMRIPWGAGGEKPTPTQQFSPDPDSMLPARTPMSVAPARGGLKASELPAIDPIRREIVNPSEPGDRSFMARVIDMLRGGATDGQPFGQQQHSPGFAGGMALNTPVTTDNADAMYPMTKTHQDTGFRGSGENQRTDMPAAVGDPTGKGRW